LKNFLHTFLGLVDVRNPSMTQATTLFYEYLNLLNICRWYP